jgi:hypothetical protein
LRVFGWSWDHFGCLLFLARVPGPFSGRDGARPPGKSRQKFPCPFWLGEIFAQFLDAIAALIEKMTADKAKMRCSARAE